MFVRAVWSADIRYIYAIRNAGGKRQLGRLDRKSLSFQPIVELPAEFVFTERIGGRIRLSLAPDGKSLATTLLKEAYDIWLLDGLTPPPTLWERLWGRTASPGKTVEPWHQAANHDIPSEQYQEEFECPPLCKLPGRTT